ncbi:MAG: carboxypeptidase M32 [Candidatus Omnitrophota bacterium]
MPQEKLSQLRARLGEVSDIHSAASLLQWDMETYMPPKAAPARGEQIATLSALAHRAFTAPEMGALLHDLRQTVEQLSEDDAKLVEIALYDYERAVKLPEAFVHEFSLEQSAAFQAWLKARVEKKFALFQSRLEKLWQLLRRKADLLGYEGSPYNALLEDYERGMTAEKLKVLFGVLASCQRDLIRRIVHSSRQPDVSWTVGEWNEKTQWDFSLGVLKDMGFDFEAGRQDKSVHPFTTNFDICDVRITTRIDERNLFSALASSIHEGGHALYEQGFRLEDRRTPLAQAISLGVHESQSRLWENMIGKSLAFWKHYAPMLRDRYPERLAALTPEQVYAAVNQVRPSLIRVEADECTYNLHIILRFEIEAGLMEGTLKVCDIPQVWNEKMRDYLGLNPPDDAAGCLQDIHWSHGLVGYFPTYALGNLYAAQIFEKIMQDIPDLWTQIETGCFGGLLGWLRDNVHKHGRRLTAPQLIEKITGNEPDCEPYLRYLENKFSSLYGL